MPMLSNPMTCSVIVPTLRRPRQLLQCLDGIAEQVRKPSETLVVRRRDDVETADLLRGPLPVSIIEVIVEEHGVVAAMVAGARRSCGRVLAITDDDAIPRHDWIQKLLDLYNASDIGGTGGRDMVAGLDDCETHDVGRLRWSGTFVGNHHRGSGGPREVAVLKGVNCSYRREALAFPSNLRGRGAQVAWEWGVGLHARSQGWRLLYDPSIMVDHFPGQRFDSDQRGRRLSPDVVANRAFNEAFIVGSFNQRMLVRRLIFQALVGSWSAPGLLKLFAMTQHPSEMATGLSSWRAIIKWHVRCSSRDSAGSATYL